MKRLATFLLLITVFAVSSCDKDSKNENEDSRNVDVFVVGHISNDQSVTVSTLWKNGVAERLSDGANHSHAYSVCVADNDIYVAGSEGVNGEMGEVANYWTNGIATTLSDSERGTAAYSITVSENDVYLLSNELSGGVVKVWKNGVAAVLTDNTYATVLKVVDRDVYVAGIWSDGKDEFLKVWKNGVVIYQTDVEVNARAYDMAISGNDVYVVGMDQSQAKLWKNGVEKILSKRFSAAKAIQIVDNDLYLLINKSSLETGVTLNSVELWKNDVSKVIAQRSGKESIGGTAMCVIGKDIYIAGDETFVKNGSYCSRALLWKNGVQTILAEGVTATHAIFVKEK